MLSGAGLQDYDFTGREFDDESGLYYYRARHYDPGVGRFLQADPLGFAAGDLNLYAYTWNDPANWTDPNGLTASNEHTTTTAGATGLGGTSTATTARGALCLANKVATALMAIGDIVESGLDTTNITLLASTAVSCKTEAVAPSCGCGGGGKLGRIVNGLAVGFAIGQSLSSFPEGTDVLTPDGPVAIETLREGDLVVARDEKTGQSGVFPVTGVMTRQALDVLWLTLERDGETSRMGVTSEHPLFTVGEGWVPAGELAPGDVVRDSALSELRVLSIEVDSAPRRVHNLEVAGAHTYFAGELEAWGHNSRKYEFALLMQLFAGWCGEIVENISESAAPGPEIWDPEFSRTPEQPKEERKKPNSKKPKSCPYYPPKDIKKVRIDDKGSWK